MKRTMMTRLAVLLVAGAMLAVVLPTGLGTAQTLEPGESRNCDLAGVDDKCEAWAASEGFGEPVVSPDSRMLYNLRGAAFDAKTGEHLWSGAYEFAEGESLGVTDIGLSPDGHTLVNTAVGFVDEDQYYHTTAWNATSGERIWTASLETRGTPWWLSVGPDGDHVYVSGGGGTHAYDLHTGEEVWSRLYTPPFVVPDTEGESVYLAAAGADGGFAVLSLDAATGEEQWSVNTPYEGPRHARDVSLSPDGSVLTIVGGDYVAAFDTEEHEVIWEAFMGSAAGSSSIGLRTSTIGPEGETLYAAGGTGGLVPGPRDGGYVVALDLASGDAKWTHHKPGKHTFSFDAANLAVHPDSSRVYVQSHRSAYAYANFYQGDLITEALDADTGQTIWKAAYNVDPAHLGNQYAGGIAIAPDGSYVYANPDIGSSYRNFVPGIGYPDVSVLAYETGGPDADPIVETG